MKHMKFTNTEFIAHICTSAVIRRKLTSLL